MDLPVRLLSWQPRLFEHQLLHQSFLKFSLLQKRILHYEWTNKQSSSVRIFMIGMRRQKVAPKPYHVIPTSNCVSVIILNVKVDRK